MSLTGSAVTFALPVDDVDRAKKFYVESLGLDFTGTNVEGSAIFALGGGAELMLLPRPGGQRSESTAMTWAVDDIGAGGQGARGRRASASRTTTPPR